MQLTSGDIPILSNCKVSCDLPLPVLVDTCLIEVCDTSYFIATTYLSKVKYQMLISIYIPGHARIGFPHPFVQ